MFKTLKWHNGTDIEITYKELIPIRAKSYNQNPC